MDTLADRVARVQRKTNKLMDSLVAINSHIYEVAEPRDYDDLRAMLEEVNMQLSVLGESADEATEAGAELTLEAERLAPQK